MCGDRYSCRLGELRKGRRVPGAVQKRLRRPPWRLHRWKGLPLSSERQEIVSNLLKYRFFRYIWCAQCLLCYPIDGHHDVLGSRGADISKTKRLGEFERCRSFALSLFKFSLSLSKFLSRQFWTASSISMSTVSASQIWIAIEFTLVISPI